MTPSAKGLAMETPPEWRFEPPSAEIAVFVAPCPEARALRERAPWLVGRPSTDTTTALGWLRNAIVSPFTQLTFHSFDLQAYLFEILHETWFGRFGHLVGMFLMNVGVAGVLSQISAAWPVDLGLVYAIALGIWYVRVARDVALWGWAAGSVVALVGLYALSSVLVAHAAAAPWWQSPAMLVFASTALVALSHLADPYLPPRAGDPLRWVTKTEFLLGTPGDRPSPATVVGRLGRLASLFAIGWLNEFWASPRLLPYNVLFAMFAFGYRPDVRATLKARAEQAWASGNPALDWVGVGGGAVLEG